MGSDFIEEGFMHDDKSIKETASGLCYSFTCCHPEWHVYYGLEYWTVLHRAHIWLIIIQQWPHENKRTIWLNFGCVCLFGACVCTFVHVITMAVALNSWWNTPKASSPIQHTNEGHRVWITVTLTVVSEVTSIPFRNYEVLYSAFHAHDHQLEQEYSETIYQIGHTIRQTYWIWETGQRSIRLQPMTSL